MVVPLMVWYIREMESWRSISGYDGRKIGKDDVNYDDIVAWGKR